MKISARFYTGSKNKLETLPKVEKLAAEPEPVEVAFPGGSPEFSVEQEGEGAYRIKSEALIKRIMRYNLEQKEALLRLDQLFKRWGCDNGARRCRSKGG